MLPNANNITFHTLWNKSASQHFCQQNIPSNMLHGIYTIPEKGITVTIFCKNPGNNASGTKAPEQKVYQFLQYINKEKKATILLTSHDLKDMEWLCRRLIILEKGEILFDDEITKIFDNYPEAETLEEIIIELFNGNTKK